MSGLYIGFFVFFLSCYLLFLFNGQFFLIFIGTKFKKFIIDMM